MNDLDRVMDLPGVSVIVPVYNDQARIGLLIDSLLAQNYPSDRMEILIVDNKSTDRTSEIIQSYPVCFLQETEFQSSYAARNRGIQQAKYDLLAFTDADCRPDSQWLSEGVQALTRSQADLAAGSVVFTYTKKDAAEIYDSINHLRNKQDIEKYHSAPTANLFVHKKIFDQIGRFPVVESGGDLIWTLTAYRSGFCLGYADSAIVYHPSRDMRDLLKKRLRVGRGSFGNWRQSVGIRKALFNTLLLLLPKRPSKIRKAIRENGQPWMNSRFWRIWMVAYLCDLTSFLGILQTGLGVYKNRRHT